jgi:hypothetical protein
VDLVIALLACYLIFLGIPALAYVVILAPRVRKLRAAENRRGPALEELLVAVGVLLAPFLMLLGMVGSGYLPSGKGWPIFALVLGPPLWGMKQRLQGLLRQLFLVASRLGRRPWAGEEGWGRPLESMVCHLLWFGGCLLYFLFLTTMFATSLEPNPR